MRFKAVFFVTLFVVSLTGCARMNSVYRDLDVDSGKGAMVDIKQRALIVSRQTSGTETKTIVCAEPSPDALSAYAAELAAGANIPQQVSAKFAASFQEGSSFVGLRTQSIQLLRDSLYRLCEGYMSGALDEGQYQWLTRRYQRYMVGLLAIEQLTGAVRAPSATISTQGSAEASRSISEMRSEVEKIDTKIASLEKEKKANGVTSDQIKELDKKIEPLSKDKEAISKGIENARGLVANGSATAVISTSGLPTRPSDETIKAVSNTVKDIVNNLIDMDDKPMLCFLYLNDKDNNQPEILNSCKNYFENENETDKLKNAAVKKWIEKSGSISDAVIEKILGLNQEKTGADAVTKAISAAKTKAVPKKK